MFFLEKGNYMIFGKDLCNSWAIWPPYPQGRTPFFSGASSTACVLGVLESGRRSACVGSLQRFW